MKTVASIFDKWKKFRTTNILPRTGWPSKQSNWGSRVLVSEVTKNTTITLSVSPGGQLSIQQSMNQAYMVEWLDGIKSLGKRTLQPTWSLPKDI